MGERWVLLLSKELHQRGHWFAEPREWGHELSERRLELRRHQAAVPCRIWLRLCLQSLVGRTAPASSPVGHRGAQGCRPFSSCTTRGSWDQDVAEPLLTRPSSGWTQAFSELLSEHAVPPVPTRIEAGAARLIDG